MPNRLNRLAGRRAHSAYLLVIGTLTVSLLFVMAENRHRARQLTLAADALRSVAAVEWQRPRAAGNRIEPLVADMNDRIRWAQGTEAVVRGEMDKALVTADRRAVTAEERARKAEERADFEAKARAYATGLLEQAAKQAR